MPYEVPTSLAPLLSLFRPCFTTPTFETFCALTVGLLTRVRERTVTGMLIAAGLSGDWHHCRAHRFFSRARWSADRLGLVALGVLVERLLGEDEPLVVAVDDTLLRRCGPKVFARHLHHDGSSPAAGPKARRIAHGNAWVVAGAVVRLPFLERAVCLPVLFRLWRPGEGPTQVAHAAGLARLIAEAHPDRALVVLGDGAYAGAALSPEALPDNVTVIARARRDLRLHAPPPPPRPGRAGRPRTRGERLPSLRGRARAGASWRRLEVDACGGRREVEVLEQRGIWPKAWGRTRVRAVALRDRREEDQIDMVVICSDPMLPARRILGLYALRWSIEVAFRDAKQHVGVGEAQDRTRSAVERTAPFAFLCLTLAVLWYSSAGGVEEDVARRRRLAPWDRSKRRPSVQDMLVALRREIIVARLSASMGSQGRDRKPGDLLRALEMVAA
ncbi:MAG: transposase [Actinobacteria bacterium]|nr:transposase [Actinomycetota bacterium]